MFSAYFTFTTLVWHVGMLTSANSKHKGTHSTAEACGNVTGFADGQKPKYWTNQNVALMLEKQRDHQCHSNTVRFQNISLDMSKL